MPRHPAFLSAALTVFLALVIAAPAALADPPSHAPAHGWRKKHDPYYLGYTGDRWNDDYGIRGGRCDRDRVGTVLGAVVGGAIGSTVGSRDNRLIAILAGATIGAIIGREIGQEMDESDRACFGHSLELLEDGRRADWNGARPGLRYAITPDRRFKSGDRVCRRFKLVREFEGARVTKYGSACRHDDGEWRMVRD